MLQDLLEEVFTKAMDEGAPESANGIASHIHESLQEKIKGQPIGIDSLRSFYTRWRNGEPLSMSKASKNDLAVYLGDKNYRAYTERKKTKQINNRRYIYAMGVMVFVIGFLLFDKFRDKCMIWVEDRYEKCSCTQEGSQEVDPIKLKKFRKLTVECSSEFFFDEKGQAKVYYYKKGDKDLELFNMLTLHPVNEDALKKITWHMIREHLCPEM